MVGGLAKICARLCKHFIEKSHLAQKYLSKNIKQNKNKQKQTKESCSVQNKYWLQLKDLTVLFLIVISPFSVKIQRITRTHFSTFISEEMCL